MSALGARAMIREHPSGWWIPAADSYFPKFLEGQVPPKRNGFQREHLLEAFEHVRKWDVAVDVGSHCGFWALDLAKRFQEVFAFEAAAVNYECLVKNLAEFRNVQAHNIAIGDMHGFCEVCADGLRPGNTGSLFVRPDSDGDVPLRTLDSQHLPGCDLLKIDVEGFELRVLQGASSVIAAYHPVIIMECSDHKFHERYGIPIGQAERWLLKRGYKEVAHMRPDKVFVNVSPK